LSAANDAVGADSKVASKVKLRRRRVKRRTFIKNTVSAGAESSSRAWSKERVGEEGFYDLYKVLGF
jgi:hypothetical protein